MMWMLLSGSVRRLVMMMSNPRKAKGTAWETAVVNFLRRATGALVFRPRQEGSYDKGDVHIGEDFALQCKNWERWSKQDLYNWVDDADAQAAHAGRAWGAAVVKRKRAVGSTGTVGTGIVAMSVDTFGSIVYDLVEGREAIAKLEEISDE